MKFSIGERVAQPGGSRGIVTEANRGEGYVGVQWDGSYESWVPPESLELDIYYGTPMSREASDPVQSPPHYDLPGGIQVIDLIRGESFLRGNLIKYVFRAPHKGNELQDMKKAAEYLKWEIERLENE